jgi:hypothetical protein
MPENIAIVSQHKIDFSFLLVNFVSGQLEIINKAGTIIRQAAFERARQISSVSYVSH